MTAKHLAKGGKVHTHTHTHTKKKKKSYIIANDPRRGWFYSFDLYRCCWRARPTCAYFFMSSYSPALDNILN
jgi:hypothetical protein